MLKTVFAALIVSFCTGCCAHRGEPVSAPLDIGSEKLARSEQVYLSHCHKCHPGGEKGLGFAINNRPLPDFLIKAQVRAGAGAMPAFSKERLTGEDLDHVVAYIDFLRRQ